MDRITRDEYYFQVVEAVALRATCDRGRNGAVIVKDGRIISTGYVGSPAGAPHCDEVGHEMVNVFDDPSDTTFHAHCIRTVHAEINAIIQAARYGPSIDGASIYCKFFPCPACAKAIINAGIVSVHCIYDYHGSADTKALLLSCKVAIFMKKPGQYNYETGDSDATSV